MYVHNIYVAFVLQSEEIMQEVPLAVGAPKHRLRCCRKFGNQEFSPQVNFRRPNRYPPVVLPLHNPTSAKAVSHETGSDQHHLHDTNDTALLLAE